MAPHSQHVGDPCRVPTYSWYDLELTWSRSNAPTLGIRHHCLRVARGINNETPKVAINSLPRATRSSLPSDSWTHCALALRARLALASGVRPRPCGRGQSSICRSIQSHRRCAGFMYYNTSFVRTKILFLFCFLFSFFKTRTVRGRGPGRHMHHGVTYWRPLRGAFLKSATSLMVPSMKIKCCQWGTAPSTHAKFELWYHSVKR